MIELRLVLQLIIAHLLSDFILQPQNWSDRKKEGLLTSIHIYHVVVVGSLSYVLSLDFGFWKAAILLTILHLLTDILKSWLIRRNRAKDYFFLDQLIHLASIIGVVILYSAYSGIDFILYVELKTIAIITGFIFCLKHSNILIKYVMKAFSIEIPQNNDEHPEETGLPNAGKLIGIVERFLTLALIMMGQYEAVGLIIAAKSILRFSGTQKNEYVLVGTLLSFGIAIFLGIFIGFLK